MQWVQDFTGNKVLLENIIKDYLKYSINEIYI